MELNLYYEKKLFFSPLLPAYFAHRVQGGVMPDASAFQHINWHEPLEFIYVLRGALYVLCDNRILRTEAGGIVAVNSYTVHSTLCVQEQTEYFYIKVYPDFYRECGLPFHGRTYTPEIRDSRAAVLFDELSALSDRREDELFIPRFKAALLSLAVLLYEAHSAPAAEEARPLGKRSGPVMAALEYIHGHFTEHLSVAGIAEAAHISESHLLHTFRAATGTSVLQYVNHLRFLYAQTLLMTSTLSVSEVCGACGFESLSYFAKEYGKRLGMTPSEARAYYREQAPKEKDTAKITRNRVGYDECVIERHPAADL